SAIDMLRSSLEKAASLPQFRRAVGAAPECRTFACRAGSDALTLVDLWRSDPMRFRTITHPESSFRWPN
ncbi:MAG TPA: hypothetical protein VFB20_01365, partial [Burkholderiales bacterium]|nr:hypothetical protein [Burkholderiales bacterium]